MNLAEEQEIGRAGWQAMSSPLIHLPYPLGSLGRPFHLYFSVGILGLGKGLVGWNKLRRSSKLVTIMMAMVGEGVGCGGWTTVGLITYQA